MSSQYLLARKWALTDKFTITDADGQPRFEVAGRIALRQRLSIRDVTGAEVAVISRGGLRARFDITADGVQATVRPRGIFKTGFVIDTTAGQLLARGNFTGRTFELSRGLSVVASVTQQRALRERFAVEVADGEDAVLMLAAILVIEIVRDERRQSAAAASAGG